MPLPFSTSESAGASGARFALAGGESGAGRNIYPGAKLYYSNADGLKRKPLPSVFYIGESYVSCDTADDISLRVKEQSGCLQTRVGCL